MQVVAFFGGCIRKEITIPRVPFLGDRQRIRRGPGRHQEGCDLALESSDSRRSTPAVVAFSP
jgi:hypothetical protein